MTHRAHRASPLTRDRAVVPVCGHRSRPRRAAGSVGGLSNGHSHGLQPEEVACAGCGLEPRGHAESKRGLSTLAAEERHRDTAR